MGKLILIAAAVLASLVPAAAGIAGNPSLSRGVVVPGTPTDDRGRHAESGDDRGTHVEPGDDRGTHVEPGDDRGAAVEPGDDGARGQTSTTTGDDRGGSRVGRIGDDRGGDDGPGHH